MSAMPITSGEARELMGTAMDMTALNMRQAFALANDTPEADCVTDHLVRLVAEGVKPSRVLALLTITREVFEWNAAEGGLSREVTGALDELARQLEHMQHGLTVKEIGRRLRWALPIVDEPSGHTAADIVDAGHAVAEVLRLVPAEQLFTDSVANELRPTNYRRLVRINAQRHNEGEMAA